MSHNNGPLSRTPVQMRNSHAFRDRVPGETLLDFSRGLQHGKETWRRFGLNANVASGVFSDIWTPAIIYPWPVAAEPLRVRAGNAADVDATGAGARTIFIEGLDADWNYITDILSLAGASLSANTANSYMRVLRVSVLTSGTYTKANTGIIAIENASTNALLAQIEANKGQTQMTQFSVKAGFKAALMRLHITVASNKPGNVRMCQRPNGDVVTAPFSAIRIVHEVPELIGDEDADFEAIDIFPEKTDLWLDAAGSGQATLVSAFYDLILIANGQ